MTPTFMLLVTLIAPNGTQQVTFVDAYSAGCQAQIAETKTSIDKYVTRHGAADIAVFGRTYSIKEMSCQQAARASNVQVSVPTAPKEKPVLQVEATPEPTVMQAKAAPPSVE